MTIQATRRRAPVPHDPKDHARRISEAVDKAWHSHFGGSRIEIPIGVVAALSLISQHDKDGPDPAEIALRLDHHGFAALLHELWCRFTICRPDLAAGRNHSGSGSTTTTTSIC